MEEFKNRLFKLNEEIEKLEKNSQEKGDKFNIFSILGIQRKEVGTHSFLLYELINLEGSHYQGNLYLDIFIKEVLGIYDFELKNFKVNRETFISGKGIKNGFIDFTIENNDYFIAIEMKIGSLETGEQLDNYRKFIDTIPNKNKGKRLYYLTLFGDEADKSKIKEDIKNGYIRISFIEHISNFIEKSIEKSKDLSTIKEILKQYQNTIKNITSQTTKDIQVKAVQIVDCPKTAKAATELSKSLAYAWAEKEAYFWKELDKKLNNYISNKKLIEMGWNKYEYVISLNSNSLVDDIMKFRTAHKTKNEDIGFKFQKGKFIFDYYSFTFHNFNYQISFDSLRKNKIFKELAKNIDFILDGNEINTKYKTSNILLNFSKDYENPTYDIFDDKLLDEIVEKIYEEIVYYMDKIIESKLV